MDRQTASDLADVMTALAGHRLKTATARVKRAPTDGSGTFTAVVSTFGPPPDAQNDVVSPGAFLASITNWRSRGKRPALWWGHEYSNPMATLGTVERMYEAEEGLIVEGKLDLDHGPALAVYEGLLAGRLNEFSIGYAVVKEHKERDARLGEYNVLDELEILEISVVHAGANRFTRLVEVKSEKSPPWHVEQVGMRWCCYVNETDERLDCHESRAQARAHVRALYANAEEMASLNERLDAIPTPRASATEVDALVTSVRLEMVEEKLAEARASSFDAELNERAANTGPVPEFDERFAVASVPTVYESGDPEPEQVVGYESETFRIAVLPGTMRPNNE